MLHKKTMFTLAEFCWKKLISKRVGWNIQPTNNFTSFGLCDEQKTIFLYTTSFMLYAIYKIKN